MQQMLKEIENTYKKKHVVDVKSGDTVKVHQRIKEGAKERVQVFEGLVINNRRSGSATATITVRRIASGVGVEKLFQIHSPLVEKIEVVKRSKVRRNNLSYMRQRSGKSARLSSVSFDKDLVNTIPEDELVVPTDDVVEEVENPVVEEVNEVEDVKQVEAADKTPESTDENLKDSDKK